MILLDPTTIIFMAMLMACAMSVILYSAHLSFPKEIQGMREWAIGLILLVIGAVLFALRETSALTSLAANAALTWGVGLTLIARKSCMNGRRHGAYYGCTQTGNYKDGRARRIFEEWLHL